MWNNRNWPLTVVYVTSFPTVKFDILLYVRFGIITVLVRAAVLINKSCAIWIIIFTSCDKRKQRSESGFLAKQTNKQTNIGPYHLLLNWLDTRETYNYNDSREKSNSQKNKKSLTINNSCLQEYRLLSQIHIDWLDLSQTQNHPSTRGASIKLTPGLPTLLVPSIFWRTEWKKIANQFSKRNLKWSSIIICIVGLQLAR